MNNSGNGFGIAIFLMVFLFFLGFLLPREEAKRVIEWIVEWRHIIAGVVVLAAVAAFFLRPSGPPTIGS